MDYQAPRIYFLVVNRVRVNIQIQKDDFQVRLKEQKERYEDDYNKLLERNLNFDFEQNQK